MALEKKWQAVVAQPFTADGTALGLVTLASTAGFKVKGYAFIAATGQPVIQVQIQYVTPTTMIVGPVGSTPTINNYTNIAAYTVANSATIGFPQQDKNRIKPDDVEFATYESDPTVAVREVLVDQWGNFYDDVNPLPVTFEGSVSITNVGIIGPAPDKNQLDVNADGSINVNVVPSTNPNDTVKNIFGTAPGVIAGIITTIVQYTVPAGKTAILERSVASGENIGTYTLLINNITQAVLRTYYAGGFNVTFEFITGQDNGLVLQAGDNVKVTILHQRPYPGDFDARIQVLEIL